MTIHLGPRPIGPEHPPLLIAEIGIGHCGDIQVAHDTVDACADAGLEAVKFQCHIPDAEMVPTHPWYETVARCSLTESQDAELKAHVEERGLVYLSTPFSLQAVERLERLGVVAYKIGSGENRWEPLLRAVAETGKPVLWSLGGAGLWANLYQHERAANNIFDALEKSKRVVPMHCISKYPAPPESWNFVALGSLASFYADALPNDVFGLSDHSRSIAPAIAAVALGASVVEVHVESVERCGIHYQKHPERSPDAAVELPISGVEFSAENLASLMHSVWLGMQPSTPDESAVARMCVRDASGRRVAGR